MNTTSLARLTCLRSYSPPDSSLVTVFLQPPATIKSRRCCNGLGQEDAR